MKKIIFLAAIFLATFTITSCNNDDDVTTEPQYYFSTTNKLADSTTVRNDAVGKWYDENNTLMVEVNKGYKNPDFPFIIKDGIKVPKSYYAYDISSTVEGYPVAPYQKIEEGSLYGNNINLSGMFHLIVEGNTGYLWVMRNTPYMIKVKKQ